MPDKQTNKETRELFPAPGDVSRGRFPEPVTPNQRCSRPGSMQRKKGAGSDSVEFKKKENRAWIGIDAVAR